MATAIGWYGPLIDLCKAKSHIGEYVQLVVFVHRARPIQKFKSSKGGTLLRTDIQVGDDTRSYFAVSIWQKQMGSMIVSGDVIMLQNIKIVKFGDVVEAATVPFSSLIPLVHPYELLLSNDVEELLSYCQVGNTTREKLKKVIKWVQQAKAAVHRLQEHTSKRGQLVTNWKVHVDSLVHNYSSISEVSCLNISCKAAFLAFVGEIFLPFTGGPKDDDEGKMFIRRRLFGKVDYKLVEDLICLGCKLCTYPMALDSGYKEKGNHSYECLSLLCNHLYLFSEAFSFSCRSLLEQNKFALCCQKSSNRLHNVCFIYRPFLLYVWDQSDYIPILVTNKGAELLFGNIVAEQVYLCYKEEMKNLNHKIDEHAIGHCDRWASSTSKVVKRGVAGSEILDKGGKMQICNTGKGNNKQPNFFRIWLILLKMLLQQGQNSSLRFEVDVNTGLSKENGRFQLVNVTMPCATKGM